MNLPNRITVGRLILALLFFAFFKYASLADASEWWKPAVAAAPARPRTGTNSNP